MQKGSSQKRRSYTRSAAFIGLSVALIAVSAWIVVPLGPIPFTLQMLSVTLVMYLLPTRQAIIAIFVYVLLGALGVPVFSGMRGGLGVLMGPTGGFLVGYLIGVPLGAALLYFVKRRTTKKTIIFVAEIAAGLIFTAFAYVFGCVQYSLLTGLEILPAFMVSCAPFIVPDVIKVVVGVFCAQPVKAALVATRNVGASC